MNFGISWTENGQLHTVNLVTPTYEMLGSVIYQISKNVYPTADTLTVKSFPNS